MTENTTTALETSVGALARARAAVAEIQAEIKTVQEQIAASELGERLAELQNYLAKAKNWEAGWRDELNELALRDYDARHEKRLHPAVGIRMNTSYRYDPAKAMTWARDFPWDKANGLTCPIVLDPKLLKTAFDKVGAPGFVETVTEPQVTVSSDLSPYL